MITSLKHRLRRRFATSGLPLIGVLAALLIIGYIRGWETHPTPTSGVPRSPVPGKPWLVWESRTIDLGRVFAGKKVRTEFRFFNRGSADLQITKFTSSCGCTALEGYDRVVKPGDAGKLVIEFDSSGARHRIQRTMIVESNCPAHPRSLLMVRGEVYRDIDVRPSVARFPPLVQGRPAQAVLEIQSNTHTPMQILALSCDSDRFSATAERIDGGSKYRLSVLVTPPFEPGANTATLTVTTDHPEQPVLAIPLQGVLNPRIQVSPRRVFVPYAQANETRRLITLINRGETAVTIVDATVSEPALKVAVSNDSATGRQQVELLVPGGYALANSGAVLTLCTNDAEYQEFEVPIVPQQPRSEREDPRTSQPATEQTGA